MNLEPIKNTESSTSSADLQQEKIKLLENQVAIYQQVENYKTAGYFEVDLMTLLEAMRKQFQSLTENIKMYNKLLAEKLGYKVNE